ncbi:MAG TPA: DUF1629 domain-containing protein [Steroidobacteraceae bacterium]
MRYFRLNDDIASVDRWHLGDASANSGTLPDLLDVRPLPAELTLSVPVTRPGRKLVFCFTSFGVPVAVRELADLILSIAQSEVQIVRIDILGDGYRCEYRVPHCLREYECLDESKSEFLKWTEANGRPELVGHYRMVTRMRIDRRMLPNDAHFFRVAKWPVVLVVSEVVKQAMERAGSVGAIFDEIS